MSNANHQIPTPMNERRPGLVYPGGQGKGNNDFIGVNPSANLHKTLYPGNARFVYHAPSYPALHPTVKAEYGYSTPVSEAGRYSPGQDYFVSRPSHAYSQTPTQMEVQSGTSHVPSVPQTMSYNPVYMMYQTGMESPDMVMVDQRQMAEPNSQTHLLVGDQGPHSVNQIPHQPLFQQQQIQQPYLQLHSPLPSNSQTLGQHLKLHQSAQPTGVFGPHFFAQGSPSSSSHPAQTALYSDYLAPIMPPHVGHAAALDRIGVSRLHYPEEFERALHSSESSSAHPMIMESALIKRYTKVPPAYQDAFEELDSDFKQQLIFTAGGQESLIKSKLKPIQNRSTGTLDWYIRDMAIGFVNDVIPELGSRTYCHPPVNRTRHPDKSNKQLVLGVESEKRVLGSFERYFVENGMPVFMLCHYSVSGFLEVYNSDVKQLSKESGSRDTITLLLLSTSFTVTVVTVHVVSGNSDYAYLQKGVNTAASQMKKLAGIVRQWLRRLGLMPEVTQVMAFPNLKRAMMRRIIKDKSFQKFYGSVKALNMDDLSPPFEEEWSTAAQRLLFSQWMEKEVLSHNKDTLSPQDLALFVGALLSPKLSKVDSMRDVDIIEPISEFSAAQRRSVEDVSQLKLTIDGTTQEFDNFMEMYVDYYYPHLETKTYRVPPIHFNIQSFKKQTEVADLVKECLEKSKLMEEYMRRRGREISVFFHRSGFYDVDLQSKMENAQSQVAEKMGTNGTGLNVTVTDRSKIQIKDGKLMVVESPSTETEEPIKSSTSDSASDILKLSISGDKSTASTTEKATKPKGKSKHKGEKLSRAVYSDEVIHKMGALQGVDILSDVMVKDQRADEGENRVISAFEFLGHKYGPMFIICSYQYNNYLNKLREEMFSKGEANRPTRAFGQTMRAEHDCLIFHKKQGAIIVCIKAIGDNFSDWAESEEARIASTNKILEKAIKQLEREEAMIHHVISDICPELVCHKLVALPNMKRETVARALKHDPALEKKLNVLTKGVGLSCLLCQDELPQKFDSVWGTSDLNVPMNLYKWWESVSDQFLSQRRQEMDLKIYKQIIGRYCGLLSTVEVWTQTNPRIEVRSMSEATSVCAQRYAKMVLLPGQVEVLTTKSKRVYLHGPPGSGKTLLLLLKAREWLRDGHQVILLNIRPSTKNGFPYAYGVERRLRAMVPGGKFKRVDIDSLDYKPENLRIMPSARVIIDEVTPATLDIIEYLCSNNVEGIWCAGLFEDEKPNSEFQSFALKQILRCPPIVQSLLMHTEHDVRPNTPYRDLYSVPAAEAEASKNAASAGKEKSEKVDVSDITLRLDNGMGDGILAQVSDSKSTKHSENEERKYDPESLDKRLARLGKESIEERSHWEKKLSAECYNASSAKFGLSTDGPRPHIIDHGKHFGSGLPMDCYECGKELAHFLFTMVRTAEKGQDSNSLKQFSKNKFAFKSTNMRNRYPHSLDFQPLAGLPVSSKCKPGGGMRPELLYDSRALSWSEVLIVSSDVSMDCPLIATLKKNKIPVEVVTGEDTQRIEDPKQKKLFVTQYKEVTGLERALIVFVPSHPPVTSEQEDKKTDPWPDLHLSRSIRRFSEEDRQALWYIASRSLSSLVLLLP